MVKLIKSIYYQPRMSVADFKVCLLKQLHLLEMPKAIDSTHQCERECHILERNHTIKVLQKFIEDLDKPKE